MTTDSQQSAARHTLVYRCATPDPAQALLFGNGRIGGSVHTPDDSLYLLVGRSDIWNESAGMGAVAAVRVRDGTRLFTGARAVQQDCDLAQAEIRIRVETPTGAVAFRLVCLRAVDVVLLEIDDQRSVPVAFDVAIENWHAGDETTATATVHVNRTSRFVEYNRRVKVDAATVGLTDPLLGRAWGLFSSAAHLPAGRNHRVACAVVCVPPQSDGEAGAAVRQLGQQLLAQAGGAADRWLAEHRQWWCEFWSRSYLRLTSATGDAEYEERVWYVNLYYLACALGGAYPPRFNGAAFLLDKDARAWDYGYWFQNMREVYWPLLASGHWEWLRGFFEMYFAARPFVQAQTQQIFGIDAPSYRETQSFWGWSPDTDLTVAGASAAAAPSAGTHAGVHHNFSNNLEVCLLMDWYTQASGDDRFHREQFYPFLKEIIRFYLAYARKGDDGQYHLAPANAIEVWPDVKDPLPDIAGLRYLLPRLIAWGETFGEEAGTVARWREFLEHLAPIPVGRWTITRKFADHVHAEEWLVATALDPAGLFLPAADKTGEKQKRCNMENAELYHVFPWGLLGVDSPAAERRRFENTWNHRTWKLVNNGWAQDVPQLARMGWAELAKITSLEHASYNQRFPNGAFISPAAPHFHGLLTNTPYLDAAGVHLTGLHEMLLQSYDGVIRICPAVSAEWSGQFKLQALGGFIVEARFVQGRTVGARITATRDATLRRPGTAARALKSGESVSFGVAMDDAPLTAPALPEVLYPGYKIRPLPVVLPTGHWHDERKGHGQIGLAEDGLFPATRGPAGS